MRRSRTSPTAGRTPGARSTTRWRRAGSGSARRGSTPPGSARAVVIDPGRAFGTGAHPTTRLCVELLAAERAPRLRARRRLRVGRPLDRGGTPRLRPRDGGRQRPGRGRDDPRERERQRGRRRGGHVPTRSPTRCRRPTSAVANVLLAPVEALLRRTRGTARDHLRLRRHRPAPRAALDERRPAGARRLGGRSPRPGAARRPIGRFDRLSSWARMATFSTRFLGCKVSFADAQAIRERLLGDGHAEVASGGEIAGRQHAAASPTRPSRSRGRPRPARPAPRAPST